MYNCSSKLQEAKPDTTEKEIKKSIITVGDFHTSLSLIGQVDTK